MRLDLTQEITLSPRNYRIYRLLQGLLYLGALLLASYLLFLLFFPSGYFTFSFVNFNSSKNTLKDPRNQEGQTLERGKLSADETLLADASIVGDYSKILVSFGLGKKSDKMSEGKVLVKKSYRAFLLPEGDPIGFPDGSLLKEGNDFFIVSDGKLRKFENQKLALAMGFPEAGFWEVSQEDLQYNPPGENIATAGSYPDDALFKVGEDFYRLSGGKLEKFVSTNAFLSRFDENEAITKDASFLNNFEISEDLLGFSDGSLIAYGISAYIVSGKDILPIGSAKTFEADGFSWGDLINASGDEISLYEKGAFFSLDSLHPDGTVFLSQEDQHFYMIKDGKKHRLFGEKIAKAWLVKRTPVMVSEKSPEVSDICDFQEKTSLFGNTSYECELSIDNLSGFLGKDYEFYLTSEDTIEMSQMDVRLKKTVSLNSLKQSIVAILGKIKGNYVQ